MYGFHRFRSWASVSALFYIAAFVYLSLKYGDSFVTPLFIGALIVAGVAAVYVIIWVTKFVIRTMKEYDINNR